MVVEDNVLRLPGHCDVSQFIHKLMGQVARVLPGLAEYIILSRFVPSSSTLEVRTLVVWLR